MAVVQFELDLRDEELADSVAASSILMIERMLIHGGKIRDPALEQ